MKFGQKEAIAYNAILKGEWWAYMSLLTRTVRDRLIAIGSRAIRPFRGHLLMNRHKVVRFQCSAEFAKVGNWLQRGRSIVPMEFGSSSLTRS